MARRRTRKTRARPPSKSPGGTVVLWVAILGVAGFGGWLWYRGGYSPADVARRRFAVFPTQVGPIPEAPSFDAPEEHPAHPPAAVPVPPALPVPSPGTNAGAPVVPAPSRDSGTGAKLSTEKLVALQQALARHGISSGSIDGVVGPQTHAALRVFQRTEGLPVTGEADTMTLARLEADSGAFTNYTLTAEDLAHLAPVPSSWLEKSYRDRLGYETALELVSERSHAHPKLIRELNPNVDWARVKPGTVLRVPDTALPIPTGRAAVLRISLSEKTLRAYDSNSNLLVHFPCSIASRVEKRPVGELHVVRLAPNPNYRFDPEIFPESAEARRIGRKLMIPPGPNNPVGTAWIGLDRPGYGIHGSPNPEEVGRTQSHGCFRLSNWNAEHLLKIAWVGLPVVVEP